MTTLADFVNQRELDKMKDLDFFTTKAASSPASSEPLKRLCDPLKRLSGLTFCSISVEKLICSIPAADM